MLPGKQMPFDSLIDYNSTRWLQCRARSRRLGYRVSADPG